MDQRQYPCYGEVPRTNDFEKFPNHFSEIDGKMENDPLIKDDQAVVLSIKDKGLVVITGCGHSGPLEYIENSIKSIRGQASQVNKNPDNFQIIMGASPNVIEGQSSKSYGNRFPFSWGSDIQRLKDMEVDHIVFVYNFLPIGRSVNQMIDTSKQLSKFAR